MHKKKRNIYMHTNLDKLIEKRFYLVQLKDKGDSLSLRERKQIRII